MGNDEACLRLSPVLGACGHVRGQNKGQSFRARQQEQMATSYYDQQRLGQLRGPNPAAAAASWWRVGVCSPRSLQTAQHQDPRLELPIRRDCGDTSTRQRRRISPAAAAATTTTTGCTCSWWQPESPDSGQDCPIEPTDGSTRSVASLWRCCQGPGCD